MREEDDVVKIELSDLEAEILYDTLNGIHETLKKILEKLE